MVSEAEVVSGVEDTEQQAYTSACRFLHGREDRLIVLLVLLVSLSHIEDGTKRRKIQWLLKMVNTRDSAYDDYLSESEYAVLALPDVVICSFRSQHVSREEGRGPGGTEDEYLWHSREEELGRAWRCG